MPLELKSILPSIHRCPAKPAHKKMLDRLTQPNWLRKRKAQRPSTPPKAETEEPPGCRGHVWRGGRRPLSLPPYPLMDSEGGRWTGTDRKPEPLDPFILDSLGLGMDGTNQKCKSRKRSRETDRSATTRTRVGGLLSVSYHSCSDKDPQLSKGPPTTRITVANPPLTLLNG